MNILNQSKLWMSIMAAVPPPGVGISLGNPPNGKSGGALSSQGLDLLQGREHQVATWWQIRFNMAGRICKEHHIAVNKEVTPTDQTRMLLLLFVTGHKMEVGKIMQVCLTK